LKGVARAAVALAVVAFAIALLQPFAGDGGDRVRIVIPRGAGLGEIADSLHDARVIESGSLFELRATLAGERDDLKPGTYYLREDMSYADVLDRLTTGPGTEIVNVTLPEGLSRRELGPLVSRAGVRGDYARASVSSRRLDPRRYGSERRPASLDGFLFPATYELRRGAGARDLVAKQLAAFEERIADLDLGYARRKNLTAFDVVTIASMVEREAREPKERPLIAAVIYNRLKQGIPLGIDATVRYATGNWSSPLTESELALDSPYNTRKSAGLPPGPIGNPGLDSLRAAARPARVGYTYFVVKPGTCGEHAFSSTFEQFTQDRERYQQAREQAGGRSPTDC